MIDADITMTAELGRDFEYGYLPTLDCKIRVETVMTGESKTEYTFFRK